MYLSSMLFMLPFENISLPSFRPDDMKWAPGKIAAAEVEAVVELAVTSKIAFYVLASLFRVTFLLVASSAASLFILLLFCFSVPVFFVNAFAFQ